MDKDIRTDKAMCRGELSALKTPVDISLCAIIRGNPKPQLAPARTDILLRAVYKMPKIQFKVTKFDWFWVDKLFF